MEDVISPLNRQGAIRRNLRLMCLLKAQTKKRIFENKTQVKLPHELDRVLTVISVFYQAEIGTLTLLSVTLWRLKRLLW